MTLGREVYSDLSFGRVTWLKSDYMPFRELNSTSSMSIERLDFEMVRLENGKVHEPSDHYSYESMVRYRPRGQRIEGGPSRDL